MHELISDLWFLLVSSKYFVPPEKIETKIAVLLFFTHRVLDSVDIGVTKNSLSTVSNLIFSLK